jgi:hypothetical protein
LDISDADEYTVRLMRAVTPFGPFRETGEEEYAHTPYSEAYLTADIASCFPVMCVVEAEADPVIGFLSRILLLTTKRLAQVGLHLRACPADL